MLHSSRFVIAGLLVVITSAIVSFAVSASMPGALMPAGTTRYAAVYATNEVVIHGDAGWMDVPGMIKYITIPGGQTADVIVIFCGLSGNSNGPGLFHAGIDPGCRRFARRIQYVQPDRRYRHEHLRHIHQVKRHVRQPGRENAVG